VWKASEGYCLWVGAGLTRQLAAGHATVPLWDEITSALESAAGIRKAGQKDFPDRLDRCMKRLGRNAFRSFLRQRYYTRLCEAVLVQAEQALESDDYVPAHLRAIANLGQIANPIVSFNIEPLSSLLLGRSAGPIRLVVRQPRGTPVQTWRESGDAGGRFQRLVYHPHGLATVESVMTASQYRTNSQTLAFGVAIHASFGNTLVIVGMSLDDAYLRRQIEHFRTSIGSIYWFNSQFSRQLSSWASKLDIHCVSAPWDAFWQVWERLPTDLDQNQLVTAWHMAVEEAVEETEGGSLGGLERSLESTAAKDTPDSFHQLARRLAKAGKRAGEPGRSDWNRAKTPREIELALRERLMRDQIPMADITKKFGAQPLLKSQRRRTSRRESKRSTKIIVNQAVGPRRSRAGGA
jgi:SIR2-like protein